MHTQICRFNKKKIQSKFNFGDSKTRQNCKMTCDVFSSICNSRMHFFFFCKIGFMAHIFADCQNEMSISSSVCGGDIYLSIRTKFISNHEKRQFVVDELKFFILLLLNYFMIMTFVGRILLYFL